MLNKNQSNKRNSWKYAVVLPLLGAFLFFFQVKVVAQEKESVQTEIKLEKIDKTNLIITKNTTDEEIKEHCEQIKKRYNIDLSFFNIKRNSNREIINIESKFKSESGSGSCSQFQIENTPIKPFKFFYDEVKKEMGYINMDLASLSKGKEIIINGEKSSQEELDKLDPKEIEKIDVAKISGIKTILVTTKLNTNKTNKTIYATDKDIYIDGKKVSQEELDKLDMSEIESIAVNKKSDKGTVRIVTKKFAKTLNDNDIYINGEKVDKNELLFLDQNSIDKMDINKIEKTIKITTKTVAQLDDKNNIQSILKQDINNQPLIIVDGIQKKSSFRVEDLPTDQIKEVNVLKGKLAQDKYGEKGKNGVVEISTKEKNGENEIEPQQIIVVGYGTKKDKVVNGFSSLDGTKPLIVVDGKTKDSNFNIEDIPKEQIKKIDVLKGKIAEDKYGEKGKNGVIEIETKGFSKN
jgi:hypothetical protein